MGQALALAVSAVLLAGFYASMAYGLGLIYGVLRVVNLAHGGMIMVSAYASWLLFTRLHIDPYLAIPIVMVVFFFIGMAIYRGLVRFLPRGAAGGVQSLLLLFGVWLVLRNVMYLLFGGDDQAVRTSYSTASVSIFGNSYSLNRVLVFAISLVVLVCLQQWLSRTYTGKAVRAVTQNPDSSTLVGIDVERIYSLTFGVGTALAGLAGVLASTLFAFNPSFGSGELLKSFVIIVLGGLGSVVGIALGALVLAFAEVGSIYVVPSYLTAAVGFVLLVVVLVVRPGGLFGQKVLR
ncbi:branched-chain amino acid transport system permease protein [Modestobacter sp. DSM 44400]|uniref:branched-chain amino acid ABC transporter permease n=1 Tax=Modestobacter sp. DSM 44400 TaxID=1550230 RepID=UPI00089CD526|nr:branched-chain amino acid ABC transporter permease [Modestobacter sp. DSM 44400]SDY38521.1 branched-chain amino acid transport system permease protein [Modestobacter sp. DSM 44400]